MQKRVLLFLVGMTSGLSAAFFRPDARLYEGEHLKAVAMPIGGIGTGTVWLAGDGTFAVWQIFNNFDEYSLPDSFMAVRARPQGGKAQVRIVGAQRPQGCLRFPEVSCVGEYPFLCVRLRDADFPLHCDCVGFNPMIPLNAKDSALPCAIFSLTATNKTDRPLSGAFLFNLLNPLGYAGGFPLASRHHGCFGANHNVYEELPTGGLLHMTVASQQRASLSKPIRLFCRGRQDRCVVDCKNVRLLRLPRRGLPQCDALLLEGLTGQEDGRLWQLLAQAARQGKPVILSGAKASFWRALLRAQKEKIAPRSYQIFEDFESGSYKNWTVEGTAFGRSPHTGTSPGQQHVSGFQGTRLVNSFLPDDTPTGRLLSRAFQIKRRFIGFLVGGGNHAGKTCVNLLVGGKVMRTATGRADERLEPAIWAVVALRGKEARIEIVDQERGPWGHINVDMIVFSDRDPTPLLRPERSPAGIASLLPVQLTGVREVSLGTELLPPQFGTADSWQLTEAIAPAADRQAPYKVLASVKGVPVLIEGPFGRGRILVATAPAMPGSWAMTYLAKQLGARYRHGVGLDRSSPKWGDMTLSCVGARPTVCAQGTDIQALLSEFARRGRLAGPRQSPVSPPGETFSGALCVSFHLEPGEVKTVPFVVTWYFPTVSRFGHRGNYYATLFRSAREVAQYVHQNFSRLRGDTELFHDTVYCTNLPYYVLDAVTSQMVIFRCATCFWATQHKETGKDYFAGFEGCYGCCPLNCTHVWNYAQAHACLYPELGRNLRRYDFLTYLKPTGETQHRQHVPTGAFIDGHCAVIAAALREHLHSTDGTFLREIYPRVKKAVNWLIRTIDPDEDGVNGGTQWNTYDVHTDGAHTFLGSQYLCALAAAERMARTMGDTESAERWRALRLRGSENQTKKLWNGEYFIQIPGPRPSRDYLTGCHADQLVGQWWSHMLNGPSLYEPAKVRHALRSIFRYNLRENFHGFVQRPRRFVADDDAGLLICTWPKRGRPDPFILYADEVWTGIEYEVASLMLYEGMVQEALRIVRAVRDRYDGRLRPNLSSGPGGNPFNELECGKFYARALSSFSLLLAAQGLHLDGPAGLLGFTPHWKPQRHRSFFVAAEGWGLFSQDRSGQRQKDEILCRWGKIRVERLLLEAPPSLSFVEVSLNGRHCDYDGTRDGKQVTLRLDPVLLRPGDSLSVTFSRPPR